MHSLALLGLTTSPPSIPAVTGPSHHLPQALALPSLRLPTVGSISLLGLTLEDLLGIRQVFVARTVCEPQQIWSPLQAYTQWRRCLTALEYLLDLLT